MARFGKSPWICPFCGSPRKDHRLKAGAGGYSIHMYCWRCGCLGPKVRVPGSRNDAWRIIEGKTKRPDLTKKARELFYGTPDPIPSTRIPTFP